MELVRQIAREGTTLILVTHHIDEIVPEIERVILIGDGVCGRGAEASTLTAAHLSQLFERPISLAEARRLLFRHPVGLGNARVGGRHDRHDWSRHHGFGNVRESAAGRPSGDWLRRESRGAAAATAGREAWWPRAPARSAGGPISSSALCRHPKPCSRRLGRSPPRSGATKVIETSTLPIAVKDEARRALAALGRTLLDCPLSGTGAQARVKDLVVYVSGEPRSLPPRGPGARGLLAGPLLRRSVRRGIEDEVRGQPARRRFIMSPRPRRSCWP